MPDRELTRLERTGQAEQMLSGLVPRLERVLGPSHRATLSARRDVAVTHMLRNRLDEA